MRTAVSFTQRRVFTALVFACLLFAAAPALHAQDEQVPDSQELAAMDRVGRWKIINTAIFAVLLGWGIAKTAPRFFATRSADIQKAIRDATGLKMEADLRYNEMDRRMSTLAEEVQRLREQGALEMEREHRRLLADAEAERDRVRRQADAEIEALRAENRLRLRQQTADQALALAERRLRDGGAAQSSELLKDFIHLVERDTRAGAEGGLT